MSNLEARPRPKSPFLLALALAATLATPLAPAPALAETSGQASTRNIALGAAAAAIGIIIYNNVQHKKAAANNVVGHTRDGGTVYSDGRIVYPNGTVLYASNGNGRVCNWNGNGERCGSRVTAYHPRGWTSPHPPQRRQWQSQGQGRGNDRDAGRLSHGDGSRQDR
jgi:hypothetical protein